MSPEKTKEENIALEVSEEETRQAIKRIIDSPTIFFSSVLGLKPFPYQEKLLEDRSKRIVVCAGRQVGKSFIMAGKSVWFSTTNPGTTTLIISATHRQSLVTFDKILRFIGTSEVLKESVVRQTRTVIQFSNFSQIVALPCGRDGDSLRAYTAHLVIVDEAAYVPEDVIKSVAMPMLVTTKGTLVLVSTPCDKKHFFYEAFQREDWSRYHFMTSDNPMVDPKDIEEARETLGEAKFRREYLAEFVDYDKTYFPMAMLRGSMHVCEDSVACEYCDAVHGKVDPAGDLYVGYDPGGMSDPAAVVVVQRYLGKQDDGEKKIVFRIVRTKTFLASSKEKQTPENVYTKFTAELADLHKRCHFKKVLMDSTGLGSPIVEHCKELGLPVQGLNFNSKSKEEILSNLKILLEKQRVVLPDNLDLLSSLNCIEAERTRMGGYTFSHARGSHDDLGYALALAVWTARTPPTTIVGFFDGKPI